MSLIPSPPIASQMIPLDQSMATVAYVVAAVLFIFSLGGLSNQTTAKRGNLFGIIGMVLAIGATIFGVMTGGFQAMVAAIIPAVVIGAVLEMVHTATLVHDDVLDEADTRRHVPTINAQWNNHTSILLGDYLFAQSFRLAATLENTRTCQWVGEAARLVCEGELRQVLGRNDQTIDRETYFSIIQGKTAELCRVACSLAAAQAGCDPQTVRRLAEYGNCLGIAFQIADDYLDLWGNDDAVGKTLGTDLEQGKITLPFIRLLEAVAPDTRAEIESALRGPAEQRLEIVRHWLPRTDAREHTRAAAAEFKDRALAAISDLPTGPAKNCLCEIAEFSIQRSF